MGKTRLLNKKEDYARLGIKENVIEPWEDGRRDDSRPGAYEWWYFDAVMDDGTKVVVYYGDKYLDQVAEQGPFPYCEIQVTLPDGTYIQDQFPYGTGEGSFATDHCDVKIGPHRLVGDLREYQVLVSPVKGTGIDLKMTNMCSSWRPGTSFFAFGEDESDYFTWLCAVPKGKVSGTITVKGETRQVEGFAYHDHQWGSIYPSFAWNHWTWARQNFGDYNMLVFDFIAAPMFEFDHYTLCFIQDKDGSIIFEHQDAAEYEVFEEYVQPETGKEQPKRVKYTMENGGKKVEYYLNCEKELETRDDYKLVDDEMKAVMDSMGLRPSYTRFFGKGDLILTEGDKKMLELSSELIYEYVYTGATYKVL